MPLPIICDVKLDLRRKYRLVIWGHVVNSSEHKVYGSTMKSFLFSILMTITAANNLEVNMGDIGNLYLNANTEENIYNLAGADFELVGIMAERTLLEVVKALYRIPTSGNSWHAQLLYTLRETIFKPTRFDPDVWIRGCKGGYNYISTRTDDVLIVAVNYTSVFNKLRDNYIIKAFGAPKVRLGCE